MQGNKSFAQPITHIGHFLIIELILQLDSEPVGFPFEMPGDSVHSDAHNGLEWGEDHLEEKERDNSGWLGSNFLGEVEGPEERRCMQESGEEGQDREDVELGNGHHLCGVEVVPVAEFMS